MMFFQWNTFEVGIWLRFCGIMFITRQIAVDQNHVGMHLTRRVKFLSFPGPVKFYTHGQYVGLINLEIPSRNFNWRIKTNEPVFYCPLVSCIIQHLINFICGLIQFLNYRHNLAYIQFNVYPHYSIKVFSMQL